MATKENREIEKDKRAAEKEKREADQQWQTQQLELLKSGLYSPESAKEIKDSLKERNAMKRKSLDIQFATNTGNTNISNLSDSE